MDETFSFVIEEDHAGGRLDKALAALYSDLSRSRLTKLIQDGCVKVDGAVTEDPSLKVRVGQEVVFFVPPPVDSTPQPENIPLDILYEDDDLIVINKSPDLVVHPGAGNPDGTLVNALLYHCKDTLSGIGGVMRPGIVHRLDKETSGAMLVAKNDMAHKALSDQLADRTLSRIYHAVVLGEPIPPIGVIDRRIGRHPSQRLKMATPGAASREAVTRYKVLKRAGGHLSLVECRLETGRTHQIRVHMESIKNPLIGDPMYGGARSAVKAACRRLGVDEVLENQVLDFPRQALHAAEISFVHPRSEEQVTIQAPYYGDIKSLIKNIFKK